MDQLHVHRINLRLVLVVGCLYLNLDHSHINLLSPSQHHHSTLYFRIYFLDNKIEKTIV
jgi:hypothetical protein